MAYRMKMFKSQKPSSFDLRVSDFKKTQQEDSRLQLSCLCRTTHCCSEIREAWAIDASNGLQIYAFPEGGIEGRVRDVCQHAEA